MQTQFASNNDLQFHPPIQSLLNGGLNLVDKEYKLPENQTPKVSNMWFYNGELGIRWGQTYLKETETVELVCYGAYKYPYLGYYIKHCGTKLYKQHITTGVSTVIYSGLTAAKSTLFKYNSKIYLKQVGNYIEWNGTTASVVVPYIPTVIINRTPTGGGDLNEGYNRLGKGFKNSFNGNNSATAYTLTDLLLDATTITCTVGGVAVVEDVGFTANRTTGVITFSVAPATGVNNVIITAYKTTQADIDSILNCTIAIPFGGQNDNRLFFGGNGTGYFYWTGISSVGVDPTYFSYNNYNIIGLTDEDITGFEKHYDTLCIFKPKEIFGEKYTWNGTIGVFETFPITAEVGCDCPGTIQIVNNNIVWLTSDNGCYILVGTQVGSQRNVFPISRNVDPRLLTETTLTTATAVNYNGKYWLCVGDKVYLWDYFLSPYVDTGNPEQSAKALSWWYFTNINAGAWMVGDTLLYVNKTTGLTVEFYKVYDGGQFFDFGLIIPAIYRYPYRLLGNGIYEFSVLRGWVTIRGDIKSSFEVTYFTSDNFDVGDAATETIQVGSFNWALFSWANFTWNCLGPIYNWELYPFQKNIRYFGVEFENVVAGTDMNISSVSWQYKLGKMIR